MRRIRLGKLYTVGRDDTAIERLPVVLPCLCFFRLFQLGVSKKGYLCTHTAKINTR